MATESPDNQTVLLVAFAGLGFYFTLLLLRGLLSLAAHARLRASAVVTWAAPRPPSPYLLPWLGAIAGGVALLQALLGKPFLHVYAQLAMALYFAGLVPLARQVRLGLYRDGVWAEAGFLRYADVARLAFREHGDIVLVLIPRRGGPTWRLPIPAEEYGAVRKLLAERTRAGVLRVEPTLPGL
jgi:hypothetical protein